MVQTTWLGVGWDNNWICCAVGDIPMVIIYNGEIRMKWDDYLGCTLGIGFFLMATVSVYAFVFDCEPTNAAMEYQLEKDYFDRTNDNWNSSFPSFLDWCDEHN